MGIVEVELASGVPDLAPDAMRAALDKRGLKAVSSHFSYGRWKNDLDNVVKEAKTLGIQYAGCAWIDHKAEFDADECADAITVFNKAGAALAKEGIKFFYHLHGFEFQPGEERHAGRPLDQGNHTRRCQLPDGRAVDRLPRPEPGETDGYLPRPLGARCT